MSDTEQRSDANRPADGAAIAALAEETDTEPSVVQHLYEEEFAALEAHSRVKNFVPLIAARRVRERLRSSHKRIPPPPGHAARRPHAA